MGTALRQCDLEIDVTKRPPRYNRSPAPDDPEKDDFKMATANDTPTKRVKLIFPKDPSCDTSAAITD